MEQRCFLLAPVTVFVLSSSWNFFLVCYFTWYEPEPTPPWGFFYRLMKSVFFSTGRAVLGCITRLESCGLLLMAG